MAAFVLPLWCFLGVVFFCKRDFVGLACILCWKEAEESVGSSPFVTLLDNLKGEK